MTTDFLFDEPLASQLEAMRARARAKRQIIYDCLQARVTQDGERVECRKGKRLDHSSTNGSKSLRTVLRGGGAAICQHCKGYKRNDD